LAWEGGRSSGHALRKPARKKSTLGVNAGWSNRWMAKFDGKSPDATVGVRPTRRHGEKGAPGINGAADGIGRRTRVSCRGLLDHLQGHCLKSDDQTVSALRRSPPAGALADLAPRDRGQLGGNLIGEVSAMRRLEPGGETIGEW